MGFNTALQANIQAYRTWAKMCYVESSLSEVTIIFCWKATGSTAQHVRDKGVFSLKKVFSPALHLILHAEQALSWIFTAISGRGEKFTKGTWRLADLLHL